MKLKRCPYILFLCVLIHISSFSQEDLLQDYIPIDSLIQKDYKTLIAYYNESEPGYQVKPDSLLAHHVAMSYLYKGSQDRDSLQIGKAYSMLGQLEGFRIDYLDKAIAYTKNSNDKFQPALAYNLKFATYYYHGNYKDASKMLLKAYEYAKKRENVKLAYDFEYNILTLNSNWGDKRSSIEGFLKYLIFLNSSEFNFIFPEYTDYQKEDAYLDTHYNLASTYYDLREYQQAIHHLDSIYERKFEDEFSKYSNQFPEYRNKILGLRGAISYRYGNYQEALGYTDLYLLNTDVDNLYGISRSLLMKGLIKWELGEKPEAIYNLKKSDSIYQYTQDEFEELGEGYQVLIAYYKEIDDLESQLEYLNKYIVFEKNINSNYIEIGNRIKQEYTIPLLLAEKEKTIQEYEMRNNKNTRYYYVFIGLIIVGLSLFIFQWYKKRQLYKRFIALSTPINESSASVIQEKEQLILNQKKELHEFDDKQIGQLKEGLRVFELENGFLNASITLQSLAEKLETNTTYLSKYINTVHGINFATYISNLRIQYSIQLLQEDAKFRSYTIAAIAKEVGFSNTRSFTNHFKRITGITVSYFMKKLN